MTPETLYDLDQIQVDDRSLVGDKALFLSQLRQRGYPSLPGLVVAAPTFRHFLETVTWTEPLFGDLPGSSLYLDVNNPAQLQTVARQIRHEIDRTSLWVDWLELLLKKVEPWEASALIVRPSIGLKMSTNPMLSEQIAGLLQSRVCAVQTAAIAHAIKQVWTELYRARSLMYWQRSGVPLQQINLALLIQPVEPAIASGDLHVSPDGLTIRAVWGLGNALSQGEVLPDTFDLNPQTGEILHHSISDKSHLYQVAPLAHQALVESRLQLCTVDTQRQQQSSLSPTQAHQLASLAQQISADFKTPLKLEWLLHNGGVRITQVNPISKALWRQGASHQPHQTKVDLPDVVQPPIALEQTTADFTLKGLAASRGQVLATALVLSATEAWPTHIPPHTALVTSAITPDLTLHLKQASGLVTDEGTMTSHGAIVARELGIPAVVGTRVATRYLKTGDRLLIDGDRGIIQRLHPASHPVDRLTDANALPLTHLPLGKLSAASLPLETADRLNASSEPQTTTALWVNLSQAETAAYVASLAVDGVGLLRSELMIRNILDGYPLQHWIERPAELSPRIAQYLEPIAAAFAPRPIYYRSLDLRSHEVDLGNLSELNPILGIHGALSYTLAPSLFDAELAALHQLQQQGYTNMHLMLPFVRTVEEVRFCHDRARHAGLLQAQSPMQLWIMAEVPSILFLIPELVAAGVQGISIGSNDLIQLLMAVDRDNAQTADLLDPRHPAVQRAIQHLIVEARRAGIPCSICGQTPIEYPEMVKQLVEWGISSISVSPDALSTTRQAIAQAEHALALKAARQHPL